MAAAALEMQLTGGTMSRAPALEISTSSADETVERLKA